VRRAALIHQIREAEEHVLLLDSGDIFQGTAYFNFFLGELEMKLMSQMGYDAATIGNHDFDGGMENLVTQMGRATFPLLSANYDFRGTPLEGKTLPYRVFERGGIRVGVFGIGIELEGLVAPALYGKTQYLDPIDRANRTALHLRSRKKCTLVVCLSHLGYRYRDATVSDVVLASQSRNIDLILGGHTHTFLDQPVTVADLDGDPVIINQVGFAGLLLGRLDISFPPRSGVHCVACRNLRV
jgi:5'-nucleotidase